MPLPSQRHLAVLMMLLLCASLGLGSALSAAQKKSTAPAKKAAADTPQTAKPIAVHEFSIEGVSVALMEVMRTAPEVVTVKWEYRNKTALPQKLAGDAKGWSDPYRLVWDSYLLRPDGTTKIAIMKDSGGTPVAARQGTPNQLAITLPPNKTIKTWAKYAVPADDKKVAVVVPGADPFENVEVTEPPPPAGK